MSRTSHTFDQRHVFEIFAFLGGFSLVLVGFPFFVIFRVISGLTEKFSYSTRFAKFLSVC